MINNHIQFAVVREDPPTEAALVEQFDCDSCLLIASGGCTALTLRSLFPELDVALVDLNQTEFLKRLDDVKANDIHTRTMWPEVRIFNTTLALAGGGSSVVGVDTGYRFERGEVTRTGATPGRRTPYTPRQRTNTCIYG